MKGKIRNSGVWFCFIVFATFIGLLLNAQIGAETNEIFIIKKYGELEPGKPYREETMKYSSLLIRKHNLLSHDTISYGSRPEKGSIASKYRIGIDIYEFSESIYAKNELLLISYERNEKIAFQTINNNKIVLDSGCYQWISGKQYIIISPFFIKIPEELLLDYTSRYPSTTDIQKSDFVIQTILHIQVERANDIIKDADPMRLLPARTNSRPLAYVGMTAQCVSELYIRCVTGMIEGEYTDCPTTLIADDAARAAEWKKFREQSTSHEIVEKNVRPDDLFGIKCDFLHRDQAAGPIPMQNADPSWLIFNELKMSPEELAPLIESKQLPQSFLPEMPD